MTGERGKQGDLIGDIYDAAIDVEGWANISAVICKVIVGETAGSVAEPAVLCVDGNDDATVHQTDGERAAVGFDRSMGVRRQADLVALCRG